MKTLPAGLLAGAAALSMLCALQAAHAERGPASLKADLEGFQEVPLVSSTGDGDFRVRIHQDGNAFDFKLTYQDLEGQVTQAHIHLAQKGVNGGITVWLCTTSAITGPVPAGTQTCPDTNPGEVAGTVQADDVVGPEGQGIAPGEFDELIRAMREGGTYANVHTDKHPLGEIRGQIRNRAKH
jgi:hypothetical protein